MKITVIGAGADDFTVVVGDQAFFDRPIAPGDAVSLSWAFEEALLLGRVH